MSRRMLALVFLAAALILSGCESAEDDKGPRGSFELVRPYLNEQVINTDGKVIRVNHLNRRTAGDEESVIVSLNGVSIYEAAEGIGEISYIRSASVWIWSLEALGHLLQQGDNTVHVVDTATGQEDTLTFFFDNQAPKLAIEEVDVSDCGGMPTAGCNIVLQGKISDASRIMNLRFNSGGQLVNVNRADLSGQHCPGEDNPDAFSNRDDCGAGSFSVRLPYPDTSGRTTEPHFSYTIEDEHGYTRTERFAAWDADIGNNMALQFNNSLFSEVKPLANAFINGVIDLLRNEDMLPEMFDDAIAQAAPGFCGGMVLNAPYCDGYVDTGVSDPVQIISPRLAVGGFDRNGYRAKLGLAFDAIRIAVRVDAYSCAPVSPGNYPCASDGNFRTTVVLENFELFSHVKVEAVGASDSHMVNIERLPLQLWLNPGWHGLNRQAVLHNSRCSPNSICAIDPNLLEFGFNLRLTADGRELADNILDDIPAAIESAELEVGEPPQPKALGAILDDAIQDFVNEQTGGQKVSHVYATKAHPIHDEPRNALLRIAGGFDVSEPDPLDMVEVEAFLQTAGLGSLFKTINHEPWYPSKEPGAQGKPIDFGLSISANMVNQFLLAEHQSGVWESKTLERDAVDLSVLDIATPLDIELGFKTNQAPRAHFTGYKKTGGGFKFELVGIGEIGTVREDIPGNIRFAADDFEITIIDRSDNSVVMDVSADISVHVCMELVEGLPQINPFFKGRCDLSGLNKSRFVSVKVNDLNMAPTYDEQQTVTQAGAAISGLLAEFFIEQMEAFNDPRGRVIDADTDLFDGADIEGVRFATFIDSVLPLEYGMVFRTFEIEESGRFLDMAIDVQKRSLGQPGDLCPARDSDGDYDTDGPYYFRALCIELP